MKELPLKIEATYTCQNCQREFITSCCDIEIEPYNYPICNLCLKDRIFTILSRYTKEEVLYMLKCLTNQNIQPDTYIKALHLVFRHYTNLILSSIKPVDTDLDTDMITRTTLDMDTKKPILIGFHIQCSYPVCFGRVYD